MLEKLQDLIKKRQILFLTVDFQRPQQLEKKVQKWTFLDLNLKVQKKKNESRTILEFKE